MCLCLVSDLSSITRQGSGHIVWTFKCLCLGHTVCVCLYEMEVYVFKMCDEEYAYLRKYACCCVRVTCACSCMHIMRVDVCMHVGGYVYMLTSLRARCLCTCCCVSALLDVRVCAC